MRKSAPRLWVLLGLAGIPLACAEMLHLDDIGLDATSTPSTTSTALTTPTTFTPTPDASSSPAGAGGTAPDAATGGSGAAPPEGYVPVPHGTFLMGSPESEPYRCDSDCWDVLPVEKQHQVTITRDFWMKATEVTQGEWQTLVGSNPSVFSACGELCPVENVTWRQTVAFCNLLSQSEGLEVCYTLADGVTPYDMAAALGDVEPSWPDGLNCLGYRLPTEAEWEYAARAGMATPTYVGASTYENLELIAWYGGNSACSYPGCADDNCLSGAGIDHPAGTQRVGQKAANPWGLFDTMGNVWELVWDVFGEYSTNPIADPVGPWQLPQGYHVARGCSWINGLAECRSAARDGNDATCDSDEGQGAHTGFRTCRTKP